MSVTILCYHKVGAASEEGRRLNIEPSRLNSHVRFFVRKNQPFFVAGDLAAGLQDGIVCFTFDDAFASTMVHAPIIFEDQGVRATFYAVPGRVGKTSDWEGELSPRPLADWDVLRDVQSRGHEIGNHSLNHPYLADLAAEEQISEVRLSHDRMVAEGLRPRSFCYPYGSHDDRTVETLRATGYEVGLALGKRPAEISDDCLQLPRVVVAYSDSLPMLLYKLTVKPKLKRLKRR